MKKVFINIHRTAFISLIFLLSQHTLQAQYKVLKVGDPVPDLAFTHVFNYTQNHLKLSDFRGKLVILDFWGVFCVPCIEEFATLDSIQKEFNAQIQIIPVNTLGRDSIQRFFKTHARVYLPALPFVTGDTALQKLFPHQGNPYLIWIDKDGKVMLDDFKITRAHVKAILTNQKINIPEAVKNSYVNTLFDERWKDDIVYSSYIVRAKDLGLKLGKSTNGQSFAEGGTIVFLYQRAWEGLTQGKYGFFRPGRTVLEVKDSDKYIKPANLNDDAAQTWMKNNYYWYQSSIPKDQPDNLYELMKEDLSRTFNLNGKIERRLVKTLALVRTSNTDKIKTHGLQPQDTFLPSELRSKDYGPIRALVNQPFDLFAKRMNASVEHGLKLPFVDQTGYTGPIDIQFSNDVFDRLSLDGLRNALKTYDMDLVEKDVYLDVLVLSEK